MPLFANNSMSADEHHVKLAIESRLHSVPVLANLVGAVCESAAVGTDDCNLIKLCLVEAANNAIIHAYREEPGNTVTVEVEFSAGTIVFDVIDTGIAADPAVMNADHRAILEEALSSENVPESGRGLAIMQEVMDSVEYTVGQGYNRLRLVKRTERKQLEPVPQST